MRQRWQAQEFTTLGGYTFWWCWGCERWHREQNGKRTHSFWAWLWMLLK